MFCPKCGSRNADESKFCRACGADLSNVLAVVEGKTPAELPLAEKRIELSSAGLRGLILGVGFLIVAGLGFAWSTRSAVIGFFALAFAFVFLATGISRFVQANALKRLREPMVPDHVPALAPGQADYIQPSRPLFETDDLAAAPQSVTEHTTTRLAIDGDPKNS